MGVKLGGVHSDKCNCEKGKVSFIAVVYGCYFYVLQYASFTYNWQFPLVKSEYNGIFGKRLRKGATKYSHTSDFDSVTPLNP